MIKDLPQDFRYGFRMLTKSPVYAFVSIITLALGIGASTAIFSVVYGVLLRPLPYQNPEQIVRRWEMSARNRPMQFADPNFEDIRAQSSSFQGMAEMRSAELPVTSLRANSRACSSSRVMKSGSRTVLASAIRSSIVRIR